MIRWERAALVAAKELRDTLRDRRTLLMMVLVPALLYPLGGIGLTQLTMSTMARLDREGYEVALQGPLPAAISAALGRDKALSVRRIADAEQALRKAPAAAVGLVVSEVPVEVLPEATEAAKKVGRAAQLTQTRAEILYDSTSPRSTSGLAHLRDALQAESRERHLARLGSLSLSEAAVTPLAVGERSITSKSRTFLADLAPLIGLLLIVLSLVGAFYPAIDLVAGERERGTLEPLLSTPTSRLEILAGKYACLALLALTNCILNLAFLGLTTGFMLQKVAGPKMVLSPGMLLAILAGTVPVLLLVSALLLLAAVFARSFKDAQNLMTPVYMTCLLPAFGALIPESHLSATTALVPILNTALFIKDALSGTLHLVPAFLAVGAGLFYSLLGIGLAALVFDRPELIGTRVMDQGLAGLAVQVGRDGAKRTTVTGALGLYGVCLALMFYVGPRIQMANLKAGLALTEIGLLLVPVLAFLHLAGIPFSAGLGLRWPSGRQVAGGALGGLGGLSLSLFLSSFVVEPLLHPPKEYEEALKALMPHGSAAILLMVLIAAVLPALCEEALCRGLVLQAARRALGNRLAIALSGFAFALLHLDPYRFLGTLVLGCLLALVAVWSDSIVPAMVMHLVNNATALIVGDALQAQLATLSPRVLAMVLLGGALLGLGLGLSLVRTGATGPDRQRLE